MSLPLRKSLPLPEGEVSYLAWDGQGPLFHFAHATGFNAETYVSLLAPLADRFCMVASDLRGHGFSTLRAKPGTAKGWTVYRDDLARVLEQLGNGPAILAGHSMGATASLMAAAKWPERVRGLVLVEPVMIPAIAKLTQFLARFGIFDLVPNLADRAELRRDSFPSFEAALAAYTGRGAFKDWPQEMIADYLRGGLIADFAGVHLACKPAWEAETFRATPFGKSALARKAKCAITVLYGTIGSTCSDGEAQVLARAGAHVVKVDGGTHFLPMQYPDLVRHEIERMAERI